MDILEHNRQAWNRESSDQGSWSIPVSTDMITSAKAGHWDVILIPLKPVPSNSAILLRHKWAYEDYWTDDIPLNAYSPSYIATRAIKMEPPLGSE